MWAVLLTPLADYANTMEKSKAGLGQPGVSTGKWPAMWAVLLIGALLAAGKSL